MAIQYNIKERNFYQLEFVLIDYDTDDNITLAQLGTLLCTQYYYNPSLTTKDQYHLATINSRVSQDVKNANDCVVSAGGTVTFDLTSTDTQKLNSSAEQEIHILLFTWFWNGKRNNQEIMFYVDKVPYAES